MEDGESPKVVQSPLMQGRGLKLATPPALDENRVSPLMQGRGLKLPPKG